MKAFLQRTESTGYEVEALLKMVNTGYDKVEALLKTVSWEMEALLKMVSWDVEALLEMRASSGYEVEASLKRRIILGMRWRYCW